MQALDLFDLHLLLPHISEATALQLPGAISLSKIEERAMSIGFDIFKSQVLSYLPAGVQARYDDPETWETLVLRTMEMLRRALQCD